MVTQLTDLALQVVVLTRRVEDNHTIRSKLMKMKVLTFCGATAGLGAY